VIHHLRVAVVPLFLAFCLILGGASAAGFWVNFALQIAGLGLIAWALVAERRTPMATPGRQLVALLALMLLFIGVQLIPLPPDVWANLGGRQDIVRGFEMLGQPLPWMPISLAPHETLASGLWLIPAIAVLLGIVKLGGFKASWLGWAVVLVTIVSIAIGALQVAGGQWYFYQNTNYGVGVGFFANGNHQATLLIATIPFLAALYLSGSGSRQSAQRNSGLLVIIAGILMVLLVGLAINRSLAGIGLGIPVVAGSLAMIWLRKRKAPAWVALAGLLVAAGAMAVPFSAPMGNNLTSAEARSSQFSRYTTFRTTLEAAQDHLPFGTGLGTFVDVYRTYEDPALVERTYINHAHSDYLELLLETGLVGAALLALFLLWWGRRLVAVWRAEKPDHIARAASIASAAMIAHSIVDYPLRTAAISALFAACCALMAEPRPRARRSEEPAAEKQARHLSAD
jgi:O-antigen ligase